MKMIGNTKKEDGDDKKHKDRDTEDSGKHKDMDEDDRKHKERGRR